jgi:hypothetical protein
VIVTTLLAITFQVGPQTRDRMYDPNPSEMIDRRAADRLQVSYVVLSCLVGRKVT